jgi:hypothetical protein
MPIINLLPIFANRKGTHGRPWQFTVEITLAGFFALAQTIGSFGYFLDLHDLPPSWSY